MFSPTVRHTRIIKQRWRLRPVSFRRSVRLHPVKCKVLGSLCSGRSLGWIRAGPRSCRARRQCLPSSLLVLPWQLGPEPSSCTRRLYSCWARWFRILVPGPWTISAGMWNAATAAAAAVSTAGPPLYHLFTFLGMTGKDSHINTVWEEDRDTETPNPQMHTTTLHCQQEQSNFSRQ